MNLSVKKSAVKELLKIPSNQREIIEKKIELLSINPFPVQSQKLSGRDCWRARVGDYRILYTLDKKRKTITVISVLHRKDAYRMI